MQSTDIETDRDRERDRERDRDRDGDSRFREIHALSAAAAAKTFNINAGNKQISHFLCPLPYLSLLPLASSDNAEWV